MFPPHITGTDKNLTGNLWKWQVGSDITLQVSCHQFFHVHIPQYDSLSCCAICNMNKHEFLWSPLWLMYYNFNNLKYSLCKIYILYVFSSDWVCVFSFHFVEPFVVEHVISVANIKQRRRTKASVSSWKTGYYKHAGCYLKFLLPKKWAKNFMLLVQPKILGTVMSV